MSKQPVCHMSGKVIPSPFIDHRSDRADCYACGRSVLVRGGRYAEHRIRRIRRAGDLVPQPSPASYFVSWVWLQGPPRRALLKVGFQRQVLGAIDTVTSRVYQGDDLDPHDTRPGHRDAIEAILIHHLNRPPAPDVVDAVLHAFASHARIDCAALDRALDHGVSQSLFTEGGS